MKFKKIIFTLAALFLMGVLTFYVILQPHHALQNKFFSFTISPNESFRSVSIQLAKENLIRSPKIFYYLGRLIGFSGKIKAGEYELNTQMSAWEILKIITGSHVKLYRLTLPEGFNLFQIANLLHTIGLVDRLQFIETCFNPQILEELLIPSFSAEGYLYPETYLIPRGISPRTLLHMFVEMFWSRIPEEFLEKARRSSFSFHELVILASLIEKETSIAAERSLMSSVFYNRLKKHMKLQSDPTSIYDLMPYGGGLVRREHLLRKTPFNTYWIQGLPLTPIANPSLESIQAALFPEQTEYLYFVSRKDSTHYFSHTYEEHRTAIQKYLR